MNIKQRIINKRIITNASIFPLFLLFGFALLSLFAPILGSNASNQSTQELSANINPVISLSAPEDLNFTLTPTSTGTFDSKELKVNVSTNAIKGYELYFSSEDEATDMKHTSPSISNKISSNFTGSLTSTSMDNNTWGYSLNNTDFSSIPKKSNQIKLKDLNTYPTATDRTQSVYFGVKADTTLPSGIYEKNVIFTAVAHANPPKPRGIFTISNMQQMLPDICKANTTPLNTATELDTDGSHQGDPNYVPTKTLTDTRDNNTYTVSKLADGKCWMTQNLRIINKTITPQDSDVEANFTIPASSQTNFTVGGAFAALLDPTYGGYYNWYTVTAGTGETGSRTDDAPSSICPKGWRLPNAYSLGDFKTLKNKYNASSSKFISSPLNFNLSGIVSFPSGTLSSGGGNGSYWSNTGASGGSYSGVLKISDSVHYHDVSISADHHANGLAVRCIAGDKGRAIFEISGMSEMSSQICEKATTPLSTATQLDTDGSHHGDPNYVPTVTLKDTRDGNTYTVSKLADGKCWMTQNLRIIDKKISYDNSDNLLRDYDIPRSSLSGFNTYDTSNAYVDPVYGGYYNWYTATAGTGKYSTPGDDKDAKSSICPKKWRLPTNFRNEKDFKTLYEKYGTLSALRSSPVNLTLAGRANSGSIINQGTEGGYFSATMYSNNLAYGLSLDQSSASPLGKIEKGFGYLVRCIAR